VLKKILKIQKLKNSKTTMPRGTGTLNDPYELSSSEEESSGPIEISSDEGSPDDSDDDIPIMVKYRKRKAAAMDEGADTEPEPEPPLQCDALRDALQEIEGMTGPDVPSRLSQVKMSPAERDRMLKIVYQRVCDKGFKGEKNPSDSATREQVRAVCGIINEVIFNGLLDRTPYIVGLNEEGTESKAGDCRPADWVVKRGKKVFMPARIQFNAGKLAAIVVVNGEIGPRLCNGLVCRDKVSIMLSVLMHEIVHLLIHAFVPEDLRKATGPGSSKWAPHGTMFMAIVQALYGHTDFKVALDTVVTSKSLNKSMVSPGLSVMLKVPGSSVATRGRVTKVNPKKAKVTMDTGDKFIVPYALLQRADPLN